MVFCHIVGMPDKMQPLRIIIWYNHNLPVTTRLLNDLRYGTEREREENFWQTDAQTYVYMNAQARAHTKTHLNSKAYKLTHIYTHPPHTYTHLFE